MQNKESASIDSCWSIILQGFHAHLSRNWQVCGPECIGWR